MKNIGKKQYLKTAKFFIPLLLAVFSGLSPVYAQRNPIDINLIIDSSSSLTAVKEAVIEWVSTRLDQIMVTGDRVTVWSAGDQARVIYTGTMDSSADRDAVKTGIRNINPSGETADLLGALTDASSRQSSASNAPYSYTLLISVSSPALSSLISGPQGNLLRFSRTEEFSAWRAIVVGLNLNARVSRAASAFFR